MPRPGRIPFALVLLPFVAGGCSSQGNVWGQYFRVVRQGYAANFGDKAISRQQAASVPYASLGYRVDGSAEAMLVLATDSLGDQIWTSSSHIVLLTHQGRILRTVGLTHDRAATVAQNRAEVPPLSQALQAPFSSTRFLDFPDIGAYSVPVTCVTTRRGPRAISILGTRLDTIQVDETCKSKPLNWSFTDNYWIDAQNGFVWHSVQHLHPAGVTVQIEILRPPE